MTCRSSRFKSCVLSSHLAHMHRSCSSTAPVGEVSLTEGVPLLKSTACRNSGLIATEDFINMSVRRPEQAAKVYLLFCEFQVRFHANI